MAFKKLVIASGQVSGASHPDFPIYVKPSAMTGWEALTLAEAQSIRIYTDEAKTNEVAREVVSADEIHVKVPTLTSSTELYVDYDGVRSDYGVTDTYGRNAVWADYGFVWHGEFLVDSTGNNSSGISNSGATGGQTGQIGETYNFDGSNDSMESNHNSAISGDVSDGFTISAWTKPDTVAGGASFSSTNPRNILVKNTGVAASTANYILRFLGGHIDLTYPDINNDFWVSKTTISQVITVNSFQLVHAVHRGTDIDLYRNGIEQASGNLIGTTTNYTLSSRTNTRNLSIGQQGGNTRYFDGDIDEIRIRFSEVSDDWITTEYNNQDDVASFWGAVTDVNSSENIEIQASTLSAEVSLINTEIITDTQLSVNTLEAEFTLLEASTDVVETFKSVPTMAFGDFALGEVEYGGIGTSPNITIEQETLLAEFSLINTEIRTDTQLSANTLEAEFEFPQSNVFIGVKIEPDVIQGIFTVPDTEIQTDSIVSVSTLESELQLLSSQVSISKEILSEILSLELQSQGITILTDSIQQPSTLAGEFVLGDYQIEIINGRANIKPNLSIDKTKILVSIKDSRVIIK